jgi:hypothetical protein
MRNFLLIALCLGLIGCTTTWEMQRDELKENYENGEISADSYHSQLEEINKAEADYNNQR